MTAGFLVLIVGLMAILLGYAVGMYVQSADKHL